MKGAILIILLMAVFVSGCTVPGATTTTVVQIGPYPDKWACEFYQVPWPGVNKNLVTCNAAGAADAFCKTALGSVYAVAEQCDSGIIVCSNPCKPPVSQIIPAQCPFDNDRQRGSQAPPLNWCTGGAQTITGTTSGEKPENCDDTYLPGYKEYAIPAVKELWDSYSADSTGVCQSVFGKGVPSPCLHAVQLSTDGNPYYLCWY